MNETTVILTKDILKSLHACVDFVPKIKPHDDPHRIIHSVNVRTHGSQLEISATDGFSVIVFAHDVEDIETWQSVSMRIDREALRRFLNPIGNKPVDIECKFTHEPPAKQVRLTIGGSGRHVMMDVVDDEFAIEAHIKSKVREYLDIEAKPLLNAMKRVRNAHATPSNATITIDWGREDQHVFAYDRESKSVGTEWLTFDYCPLWDEPCEVNTIPYSRVQLSHKLFKKVVKACGVGARDHITIEFHHAYTEPMMIINDEYKHAECVRGYLKPMIDKLHAGGEFGPSREDVLKTLDVK